MDFSDECMFYHSGQAKWCISVDRRAGHQRKLHGLESGCPAAAYVSCRLRHDAQTASPELEESSDMQAIIYFFRNFSGFRIARPTFWLAAAALMLSSPAMALSDADEKGVRAVVQAQLAALARDDAAAAYAFAAPNVREQVKSAAQFMAMVRSSYPAIYRPASTAFLKAEAHHGQVIQRVQLTDEGGSAWLALYSLQRQKDKSWRITGCQVIPNQGRMA